MYAELIQKICTKCGSPKMISWFRKDPRYTDGYHGWCRDCKNESQRKHPDTIKDWVVKNKARAKEIKQRYVEANQDKVKTTKKRWYLANPEKRLANCRIYQASKLRATPPWLSKAQKREMQNFYLKRPKGFEVDHIVPLRGNNVWGLHVPWNLQYLESSANRKKSNKNQN